MQDVRWKQRLSNFSVALTQLEQAVALSKTRLLSDLEKQGLIKAFEFTHELAWNLLKDYFEYQGTTSITGSRDATREAFNKGLISNADEWMEMIKSRNQTSHTYNKKIAEDIVNKIRDSYCNLLSELKTKMSTLK